MEEGIQQVSMDVDVLNRGQTGIDHDGQGEVPVNRGIEAVSAEAKVPSGDEVDVGS
jgi:hypothetical protein